MSKTRRWITLLLALFAIILLGWNLADSDSDSGVVSNSDSEPTYLSDNSHTVVYNPDGALSYKLASDKVTHYATDAVSWFDNPKMTTYDENKVATWSVRADKAKLTNDRMLFLYGNVEVTSLTPDAQLKKITTDNALVNLTTQDVTSNDRVTLYGRNFNSTGMKMRGNLRKKTAELIEKVKTSYEIQNEQQP